MRVNLPPLEPPDLHLVRAAEGWLELHLPHEAEVELAQLSPEMREHPAVLEIRWHLHAAGAEWQLACVAADRLIAVAPQLVAGWIHRAYATRRMTGGGLTAAWEALLPAAEHFPDESLVPYNLACYACQLSRLEVARHWLQRALSIAGQNNHRAMLLQMALADADLAPLHAEIPDWPQP